MDSVSSMPLSEDDEESRWMDGWMNECAWQAVTTHKIDDRIWFIGRTKMTVASDKLIFSRRTSIRAGSQVIRCIVAMLLALDYYCFWYMWKRVVHGGKDRHQRQVAFGRRRRWWSSSSSPSVIWQLAPSALQLNTGGEKTRHCGNVFTSALFRYWRRISISFCVVRVFLHTIHRRRSHGNISTVIVSIEPGCNHFAYRLLRLFMRRRVRAHTQA